MHTNRDFLVSAALFGALVGFTTHAPAQDKITYADHVLPLITARCMPCHGSEKLRGGLDLSTYPSAIRGGSSGEVLAPGDPDSSRLYRLVMHQEEPNMPPASNMLSKKELDLLRRWIAEGLLETSGSAAKKSRKPKISIAPVDPATRSGDPNLVMPEQWRLEPFVVTPRAFAIASIAAHPFAPLFAVTSQKQVLLYHAQTLDLIGIAPFPDGQPQHVTFSSSGDLLVVAGGHGAVSGRVHLFDLKSGERVGEIGEETDSVLAADISANRQFVALGTPQRLVKIYSTADGALAHTIKKHTDWVTAVDYSPDGVLLATADRAGNLLVWEAATRMEFYTLAGHTAAITSIAWRADSNLLASSSEDGSVRLWEMYGGQQVKNWTAHPGGVESVAFAPDGRMVTTGRDRNVSIWNPEGVLERVATTLSDLALEAAFTADGARVVAGDFQGLLRVVQCADGKDLADVTAHPPALATRVAQAQSALVESGARANTARTALEEAQARAVEPQQQVRNAQAELEARDGALASAEQEVAALDQEIARLQGEQAKLLAQAGELETRRQSLVESAARRAALQEELRTGSERGAEVQRLCERLSELLRDLESSAARSNGEPLLVQVRDQCAQSLQLLEEAGARIAKSQADLQAQADEIVTRLSPQILAANASEIVANQAALAQLAAERSQKDEQRPARIAMVDAARAQVQPLLAQRDAARIAAQPFEEAVANAAAALESVVQTENTAQREFRRWQAETINLERWQLKDQLAAQRALLAQHDLATEDADAARDAKQAEIGASRAALSDGPARMERCAAVIAERESLLAQAHAAAAAEQLRFNDKRGLAQRVAEQKAEIERTLAAQPGNEPLIGAAQKLAEALALIGADVQAAEQSHMQSQAAYTAASQAVAQAHADCTARQQRDLDDLPMRIAALQAELAKLADQCALRRAERQQVETEIAALEAQIAATAERYRGAFTQ